MGQANNSFENQANRTNANIYNSANMNMGAVNNAMNLNAQQLNAQQALNAQQMNNATNLYQHNQDQQQNAALQAGRDQLGAGATYLGAAQQQGQNDYNNTWGNVGNTLGVAGSVLGAFSDEKLKHYRECSKKVVIRSPNSIKKLKFVKEGTK